MKQLFITGVGRSGTTLLQSILNAHDDIDMLPESHYFKRYLTNDQAFKTVDSKFLDTLSKDHEFGRLDYPVSNEIIGLTRAQLYKDIVSARGALKGVKFVGDKDPSFCDSIKDMSELQPNSYLIHIIRDPRDVILSRVKSGWGQTIPFVEHVYRYENDIKIAREQGIKSFGGKYIEVYYEELLDKPEEICKGICKKLDVEFSKKMLEHHKYSSSLFDEKEAAWKQNVEKPIIKENSKKWIKGLSKNKVKTIESYCSYAFQNLRYEKSSSSNSWLVVLYIPIFANFCKIVRKIKRRLNALYA